MHDVGKYLCDELYSYKICSDNIIRWCILKAKMLYILEGCHLSLVRDHHGGAHTATIDINVGTIGPQFI